MSPRIRSRNPLARILEQTTAQRRREFIKPVARALSIWWTTSFSSRYELESLDHHHHIICIDCDKVEDIVLEKYLDSQEQKIMRQKKFKTISHSLEFFGLCAECNC